MDGYIIKKLADVKPEHIAEHENYEYFKKSLIPRKEESSCVISVYEIPPGKSAYPYHYHKMNEEAFYIIKGTGLLRAHDGERRVFPGDFLFFPDNENGAHKLTNISETENLVYLDFSTKNDIDVAIYPDSNKIGVWGKAINKLYDIDSNISYYKNE